MHIAWQPDIHLGFSGKFSVWKIHPFLMAKEKAEKYVSYLRVFI